MTTPLPRGTSLLLNVAHALDHMFLLIFATAVGTIATEFGFARWEDLMPYSVGAFLLYGLGSLPAGRLGDLWGRRRMMLVFFFGMAGSSLLAALARDAWQLAAALTLLGAFAAIYHPVGIPMLVRHSPRPGITIGVNGLAGNLGVAAAAAVTGALVEFAGWRASFAVPAIVSLACGIAFLRHAPEEPAAPARAAGGGSTALPPAVLARVFAVMTVAAIASSLAFNLLTNGNGELLRERMTGIVNDPARLGLLLAAVYVVASFAQVVVGLLIDRVPLKRLFLFIVAFQVPLFALAAHAQGWWLWALQMAIMIAVFGAIPFTDALIVRFVDDRMRSRVTGMRFAIAFGLSSAAVWALGPVVKAAGFSALLLLLAGTAALTLVAIAFLPGTTPARQAAGGAAAATAARR